MRNFLKCAATLLLPLAVLLPGTGLASEAVAAEPLDLTGHGVGIFALVIFTLAYLLVMAEEFTHLRKSNR